MVIAMIEELAKVVKIENHQVWVESGQNNACGGCLQKASCTTNALGNVLKKKSVPVDSNIQLKTGDEVMVAIDESLLLRASLLLYLLPLIALFTGAGIADWLLADNILYVDLWIAGSAFLSFLFSLWLINKAQSLLILNYYARPVVVRKI
jgi:sigma-E factor negative regulatory protein RseC